MRKTDWRAALLWPVTVPAGFFGVIYFAITRRHPPTWLLLSFGMIVAAAIAWAVWRVLT